MYKRLLTNLINYAILSVVPEKTTGQKKLLSYYLGGKIYEHRTD